MCIFYQIRARRLRRGGGYGVAEAAGVLLTALGES